MNKQKGFVQFIILGVVVLAVVAAGAFYLGKQTSTRPVLPQDQVLTPQATPSFSPTADEAANWKTYTNSEYNFSFKYPPLWNIKEILPKERYDALEIDIQSPRKLKIVFYTNVIGLGGACDREPPSNMGFERISMFNKPMNLFYVGDNNKGTINYAYVYDYDLPCPNIAYFDNEFVGRKDTELTSTGSRVGSEGVRIFYKNGDYIPSDSSQSLDLNAKDFKSSELEVAKTILSTFRIIE